MSKKVTIAICVVLFIALGVLMVCERMNPEAGYNFLHSIL